MLICYGCEALTQYRAGFSTFSQAIPLAMTGFMIAAAIDTTVAFLELARKIIIENRTGCTAEILNLALQATKLAGAILLFNSNPAGWVFLAAVGAMQLGSLLYKTYEGNVFKSIGFFGKRPGQATITPEGESSFDNDEGGIGKNAMVGESTKIMGGFTGRLL